MQSSAINNALCATNPKARTIVLFGKLFNSALRNELQLFTSSKVGLFSGGRHFTAFVILQFLRIRPSSGETDDDLLANVHELLSAVMKSKPAASKGTYLKSVYISSTMGPSLPIDVASLSVNNG